MEVFRLVRQSQMVLAPRLQVDSLEKSRISGCIPDHPEAEPEWLTVVSTSVPLSPIANQDVRPLSNPALANLENCSPVEADCARHSR